MEKELAKLYGVLTKNLNKAVRRNVDRFPEDFMIRLTKKEYDSLRFQIGTIERGAHSKYLSYAFTEQGVAMLSSVLRSRRAIQVNIAIMRAFVKIREVLLSHKELNHKLEELQRKVGHHDKEIKYIIEAIRQLMDPPPEKKKEFVGFHP